MNSFYILIAIFILCFSNAKSQRYNNRHMPVYHQTGTGSTMPQISHASPPMSYISTVSQMQQLGPMPQMPVNCPSICPLNYSPVCGYNGRCYRQFGNVCEMSGAICSGQGTFSQVSLEMCTRRGSFIC